MSFNMQHAEEFRKAYNLKSDRSTRTIQLTLIDEEFNEFCEAERQVFTDVFKRNDSEALKELADLVYVCYQYAANMEWDLDQAMIRVHESNMSKLGDNGKPIYRADGKVLKGPNYKEPTLTDLV